MSTSIFIEQLAAGHAADAKETLSNLLSARAFEALDERKQELASTLFGGQVEEEVEQIEENKNPHVDSQLIGRGWEVTSTHHTPKGSHIATVYKTKLKDDNQRYHSDVHPGGDSVRGAFHKTKDEAERHVKSTIGVYKKEAERNKNNK